jgi:outer membrane protein assembly factor BamB
VADGKIYLIGMDGTVTVLKTGREYQVLAQNKIDERLAASLAVAGNTIYLRSYDALYAIAGD